MCTVKEIQEAIREDCKSQHDMDSTDIDRVMQTLPFAQEEPFTEARPRKPLFWFYARKFEKCLTPQVFGMRIAVFLYPKFGRSEVDGRFSY